MTIWLAERRVHELSLAAGAALVFGLAAAAQPKLTLGAAVAVVFPCGSGVCGGGGV